MNAKIEMRGVEKIYSSAQGMVHALEDINLTVEDGEFLMHPGTFGLWKINPAAYPGWP